MEERMMTHEHNHPEPQPELRHESIDFLVERGQRGGYGWEIGASAPGHDVDTLLAVIRETTGSCASCTAPTPPSRPGRARRR